ncbi:hypothetical protein AB0M34_12905 [Nocardia sp. NPDC050193]
MDYPSSTRYDLESAPGQAVAGGSRDVSGPIPHVPARAPFVAGAPWVTVLDVAVDHFESA